MSSYKQDLDREIARLRNGGGGWPDDQIEMMARRSVAFARGRKTTVVCRAVPDAEGRHHAIVLDAATGSEVVRGEIAWERETDAKHQAQELAFARGLDPVQE